MPDAISSECASGVSGSQSPNPDRAEERARVRVFRHRYGIDPSTFRRRNFLGFGAHGTES